jgi:hypothetical protein
MSLQLTKEEGTMRKQSNSMLVFAILTAFVAMAVFLPGMTLTVETAEAAPPEGKKKDKSPPAPVPKTGQTTSYATGDDGDLQKGVAWPDPRFTNHRNGTVTDNLTGLMWTLNANIYYPEDIKRSWEEALYDCTNCTEGGYIDWRLPNVKELLSLIDFSQEIPALPPGHPFNCGNARRYWSSTTAASDYPYFSSHAWLIHVGGFTLLQLKDFHYYVWCVRGGE